LDDPLANGLGPVDEFFVHEKWLDCVKKQGLRRKRQIISARGEPGEAEFAARPAPRPCEPRTAGLK
jgi:hypothetical protein